MESQKCKTKKIVEMLVEFFGPVEELAWLVLTFLPRCWALEASWSFSSSSSSSSSSSLTCEKDEKDERIERVEMLEIDSPFWEGLVLVLLLASQRRVFVHEALSGKLLHRIDFPESEGVLTGLVSLEREGCFVTLTGGRHLRVHCVPSLTSTSTLALDETTEQFEITALRALGGGLGCAFVSRGREIGLWTPGDDVRRPVQADEITSFETSGCLVGYHRKRRTSWTIEILNAVTGRRLLTMPSFPVCFDPVCRGFHEDEFTLRTWDQQLLRFSIHRPGEYDALPAQDVCVMDSSLLNRSLTLESPSFTRKTGTCATRFGKNAAVVFDRGILRIQDPENELQDVQEDKEEESKMQIPSKNGEKIALRGIMGQDAFLAIDLAHKDVRLFACS